MKTAERTIERPRVERVVEQPARRSWATTAVVAVLALVLGLVGGYLLRGSDDVDPTDPVTIDGVELTDRQEQMVEVLDDYVAAWQQGDGAAAEALFTENGELNIFGTVRTATDGAIADLIDGMPTPSLQVLEPILVNDHEMLSFHTTNDVTDYVSAITFSPVGEVLIVRHEMIR